MKKDKMIDSLNCLRSTLMENSLKIKLRDQVINKMKKEIKILNHENSILKVELESFKNKQIESREDIILENDPFINYKTLSMTIPRWIPDAIVKKCKDCNKFFGCMVRKHHCRKCGEIFCSSCSNNFQSFYPYFAKKVRTCKNCFLLGA
jgi:hypothetical protein